MKSKKFTVEKTENLWKVKYDNNEWYFQTLEDLCLFMEDHLDTLEQIKPFMISDNSIN